MDRRAETWFRSHWRPAMGWTYMAICIFDFIVAPALMIFLPIYTKTPYVAWKSITLDSGGLIHVAFGAILGVSAWSRGNEKLAHISTLSKNTEK